MENRFWHNVRLVFLVASDVYRAAVKERMLYGFLLLAFLFILMANVPFMVDNPKVFDGQTPEAAALQIGFVAINIFTILIAIFVSLSTLQNFLSRERLAIMLSKPVYRWQVLEGVVGGLFAMVFLNWFLMTAGVWLVVVSHTKGLAFVIWKGLAVTVILALLYVTLVVFFYSFIPNAVAGVLAMLVIIAGFGAPLAEGVFQSATSPALVKEALKKGLYILPPINALLGISMGALKFFKLRIDPFGIFLHAVCVIVFFNLAACLKFRRFCKI